jgi:hypothetical protein
VVFDSEDFQVAKIQHESVGLPAEEKFYLDSGETQTVEEDCGAHSVRMRRPTLELLFVFYRIEIVNSGCGTAHCLFDIVICD